MSNEQKLLHVALEAINALMMGAERYSDNHWGRICMPTDSAMSKGADAAMAIRQALATTEPVMANGLTEAETDASASVMGLATTEPEPTGLPELPEPDEMGDRWLSSHVYTADQMLTYGEQCWKSGYKHGAWGDKPAVNQQLTTEPIDEREAFEKWATNDGAWPGNAVRSCLDSDKYANSDVQGLWLAWQAGDLRRGKR